MRILCTHCNASVADTDQVRSIVERYDPSCTSQKISTYTKRENPSPHHLLVFVSSSMPKETLKTLMQEAQKVGGVLVLRGLVLDSFKKTATFVQDIGKGLWIDPTLFEAYAITIVPTFVVTQIPFQKEGYYASYDKISGNITLSYALEQLALKGETQKAKQLFSQLKTGAS